MQSVRGSLFEKLYGKNVITDHWYKNSVLDLLDKVEEKTFSRTRFYLDCGDDDTLLDCTYAVHLKMNKKKIKHEFRVRDGYHSWTYWRTALPSVLEFISVCFKRS